MKDLTKKILLGAGTFAFAGLAAVGGYFFAKNTSDDNDDSTSDVNMEASAGDADDTDDTDTTAKYDYSEMSGYITLGEYKGIKATRVVATAADIDDETIDSDLEYELEEYKEYSEVTDRGIKQGDYVVLNCTVSIGGEEISELEMSEYEAVIGEDMLFTELENALIGMESGASKDINLTLPEDYEYEEYANQAATFSVTIDSIEECTYDPKLTDAFVKEKVDGCNTIQEWKDALRKDELAYLVEELDTQLSSDIFQAVHSATEFTDYDGLLAAYPTLFDDKYAEIKSNYDSYAQMFGMSYEDYIEFAGMTEDDIKNEVKNTIKGDIILYAIIKKENITVSDDEIQAFAENNYADYDMTSVDEFFEYYTEEDVSEYLLSEKCYDFLIDNAEITEISYADYQSTAEDDTDDDALEFEEPDEMEE